jgi:fumarate reductase flavoprotein subunit
MPDSNDRSPESAAVRPQTDADLIVVGAGAAGLFSALVAAQRGAGVLLLERDLDGPSNLLVSGGLFPDAGSRLQAAAGITDSAARFAADVTAKAGGAVDAPVLVAIAAQSAPAVHFLTDELQLPIRLLADLQVPGHTVCRMHATPAESGRELHQLLRAAAVRHPRITLLADAEGVGLTDSAGAVVGVRVPRRQSGIRRHFPVPTPRGSRSCPAAPPMPPSPVVCARP